MASRARGDRGWTAKGHKRTAGVTDLFYVLIVVAVTDPVRHIHRTVHQKE